MLVLGAGPAGCAAAIQARQAGLSVTLLDSRDQPQLAPGETLHPGVEAIFARLGVWPAVRAAGFYRHLGIWVARAGERRFHAYGADRHGPWHGFQVERARLHCILQDAAEAAGARFLRGRSPRGLILEGGRVGGVQLDDRLLRARWVVDASGRHAWLATQLGLAVEMHSPPLRVRFGWRNAADANHDGQPCIVLSEDGWDWEAPLGQGRIAWLALRIGAGAATDAVATAGKGPHGIDLAWRLRPACAGPGYFLAGDAAALIDPSSSHGVLRALMSGMYAGFLAAACTQGRCVEAGAAAIYRDWLGGQFAHDIAHLRAMHGKRYA